jgi:hypothetical protein
MISPESGKMIMEAGSDFPKILNCVAGVLAGLLPVFVKPLHAIRGDLKTQFPGCEFSKLGNRSFRLIDD